MLLNYVTTITLFVFRQERFTVTLPGKWLIQQDGSNDSRRVWSQAAEERA
jgi:hypothetical protein